MTQFAGWFSCSGPGNKLVSLYFMGEQIQKENSLANPLILPSYHTLKDSFLVLNDYCAEKFILAWVPTCIRKCKTPGKHVGEEFKLGEHSPFREIVFQLRPAAVR